MAFPTIAAPTHIGTQAVDNSLKSPTDAGYVQARPRTTRDIRNFDIQMKLKESDLALLLAHDSTVKTHGIFSWYNCEDDTTYNVRQTERVKYDRSPEQLGYYDVSFKLQSV